MSHLCRVARKFPLGPHKNVYVSSISLYRDFSAATLDTNTHTATNANATYDQETGYVSVVDETGATTPKFQTVIGLEIHAQLQIPTKLFSSPLSNHFQQQLPSTISEHKGANGHVSLFDLAIPGSLPILSGEAVRAAVISSHALSCTIHPVSRFERKHYTYADLPLGYQMTQQRWPIASDGTLRCRYAWNPHQKRAKQKKKKKTKQQAFGDKFFEIGIERIQIEQDTGKTTTLKTKDVNGREHTQSLIDYNRAGCALIEIVFRPDIRSASQAASAVLTLRQLLSHIGTCDGNMHTGSLRCDLNVSLAPVVDDDDDGSPSVHAGNRYEMDGDGDAANKDNPFGKYLPPNTGNRVEVKNLNSVRQVILATEYEALRQTRLLQQGVTIPQETRTFNAPNGCTVTLRSKEDAIDYRFMPEPDVPPVILNRDSLAGKSLPELLGTLPELPEAAVSRLMIEYTLDEDSALVIVSDGTPAIDYFERAVRCAEAELQSSVTANNTVVVPLNRSKIAPVVSNGFATTSDGTPAIGYFERAVRCAEAELQSSTTSDTVDTAPPKRSKVAPVVSKWLCNDLFGMVKKQQPSSANPNDPTGASGMDQQSIQAISIADSTVSPEQLGSLVSMILSNTISTRAGKNILSLMFDDNDTVGSAAKSLSPRDIADANGWKLVTDQIVLRNICETVMRDPQNTKQLTQYRQGKMKKHRIVKYLLGKAMSESQGNAQPMLLEEILTDVLG
eukprot:CAMPEP_0194395658 /NCGR_PEP_ID=MMETSP0174-20130528/124545_1 /TAXON_ID=216777 /ORGANISM="Proboscia alata, Strain PI-D3" /LENGTH=730 /DNA_ID=CAMNT_0039191617 /DNA_START=65 /DNA_END=2258 /DNA_ORIENTATION=-